MHRRRIALTAALFVLGLSLSACESFDPSDWFNPKKPLPGERKEVFPGGSATYTVMVKPVSGFSGPVSLSVGSESGFPTGITSAGFSPATISGSGTSTLTMTTTIATVPWALSLTVSGTSGSLSHTASSTLLVNLAPPAALIASPGDRQVALAWPASVGATGYHV